jgi:chemotaxis protein MotA
VAEIAQSTKTRIDPASVIGVLAGPGCILLGQWLEGGDIKSLLQRSAGLIVIGATMAACLLSFSPSYLFAAARDLRKVISEDGPDAYDLIERIISYAAILRKEGPVPLQKYAREESYGMLATGLNLVINNVAEEAMSTILDRAFHERVLHNNAGAEVFEAAGGYFPTFGILGAVLGLIHVMHDLSDPAKVGVGIGTAFVATVYGVGLANLVAYPAAKKIRARAQTEKQLDQIVVTGVKGMREGMSPSGLRQLLTEGLHPSSAPRAAAAAAAAPASAPEAKAA